MQGKTGAPGGTRTPDLPLRRRLLYPAELLAHIISHLDFTWINGAGDGNRTHTTSLEGWDSTIELHPQNSKPTIAILLHFSQKVKHLFQFFPCHIPRSQKNETGSAEEQNLLGSALSKVLAYYKTNPEICQAFPSKKLKFL